MGKRKPFDRYKWNRQMWGKEWADRCKLQSEGVPMPEPCKERTCDECKGYGHPGWFIENNQWKRCQCNPETANES